MEKTLSNSSIALQDYVKNLGDGEASIKGFFIEIFKIKAHIRRSGTSRNNQRQ